MRDSKVKGENARFTSITAFRNCRERFLSLRFETLTYVQLSTKLLAMFNMLNMEKRDRYVARFEVASAAAHSIVRSLNRKDYSESKSIIIGVGNGKL